MNRIRIFRIIVRSALRLIARVEIIGWEHLPKEKNFIVAANHIGMIDPALFFYALDRDDLILPLAEKYQERFLTRLLGTLMNAIWIDRFNPDIKALRQILERMKAGGILVIAPEGTRSPTGSLIEGRPGVSYLAAKTGYPVLPIALLGTTDHEVKERLRHFKKLELKVVGGPAFTLPPLPVKGREEILLQSTDMIMCHIAALLPEERRGIYAENPRLKELLAGKIM
jgi:1-acyl-sn-glycerol-3-phosphate acyltransferase